MRTRLPAAGALTALLALAALPATARACEGTLAGAVVGRFPCAVRLAEQDGVPVLEIAGTAPVPDVPGYAPGAFEVPAPVRAGTYTLDTLGPGRASVAAEGGVLYTASRTTGRRGSVTLVLADVRPGPTPGTWVAHGTYRAHLLPVGSGRTGEVIVEVRF